MRGEKIYKILDMLENAGMDMVDLTATFLSAGYGASMGKIDYGLNKKQKDRAAYKIKKIEKRQLEQYIYKLKKDGLLHADPSGKIKLSPTGKKKIKKLRKNKLLDKNYFQKENGSKVIILSYDLPIAFNRERDLLRGALLALGFNKIHQSVWVGKVRIPTSFIHDLKLLGILRFIEILEVTKQGSLKTL